MAAGAHQITGVRVLAAFNEELGDSPLQGLDVPVKVREPVGGLGRKVGDVVLHSGCESDPNLTAWIRSHGSVNFDAEPSERLNSIFGTPCGSAPNALRG